MIQPNPLIFRRAIIAAQNARAYRQIARELRAEGKTPRNERNAREFEARARAAERLIVGFANVALAEAQETRP